MGHTSWLCRAKRSLNQEFDDDGLEREFVLSREKTSDQLALAAAFLLVLYTFARAIYIGVHFDSRADSSRRFGLSLAQCAVSTLALSACWLQVRRRVWGMQWEKVLVISTFFICLTVFAQFHPIVNICGANDIGCWNLSIASLIGAMHQVPMVMAWACRAGTFWGLMLIPTLVVGVSGLVMALWTCFGQASQGFEAYIMVFWCGPMMAIQTLGLGWLQERTMRQVLLQLKEKADKLAITEARVKEDTSLSDGLLRLAMARFEAVLGLTEQFAVATATAQADELLNTKAQAAKLLDLIVQQDADELARRLENLRSSTVSMAATTITMTCQLRHGGSVLRVVGAALDLSGKTSDGGKDVHFIIGLEKTGVEPALPDLGNQDARQMLLRRGRQRNRPHGPLLTGRGTPRLSDKSELEAPNPLLTAGSEKSALARPGSKRFPQPAQRSLSDSRGHPSDPRGGIHDELEEILDSLQGTWKPTDGSTPIIIIGEEIRIGKSTGQVRKERSGDLTALGAKLEIVSKDVLTLHFDGRPEPLECRRAVFNKLNPPAVAGTPRRTGLDDLSPSRDQDESGAAAGGSRGSNGNFSQVLPGMLP